MIAMRKTFPQYLYVFITNELVIRISKNTKISAKLYGSEIAHWVDRMTGCDMLLVIDMADVR